MLWIETLFVHLAPCNKAIECLVLFGIIDRGTFVFYFQLAFSRNFDRVDSSQAYIQIVTYNGNCKTSS